MKEELSALKREDYTRESWDKLQTVLKQAEAVAEDVAATQQKMESMMKNFADASKGLEKIPEPELDPIPDSGSSGNSSSDSSYVPAVKNTGVNAVTGVWTMTQLRSDTCLGNQSRKTNGAFLWMRGGPVCQIKGFIK